MPIGTVVLMVGLLGASQPPSGGYALCGALFEISARMNHIYASPTADRFYALAGKSRGAPYSSEERRALGLGMLTEIMRGKINQEDAGSLMDTCNKGLPRSQREDDEG